MTSPQNPPLLSRTATLIAAVALLLLCVGSGALALFVYNQLQLTGPPPAPSPASAEPPPEAAPAQLPIIGRVLPNTTAQAADLQPGDLIIALDDSALRTAAHLVAAMEQQQPGDQVTLVIRRGDDTLIMTVTLGANPAEAERAFLGIELIPPLR